MSTEPGTGELKRILTLGQLVLFGVTFVGPTAPFPMFGIVSHISRGHMALAYVIAMVAMVLTAHSYGRMAAVFPAAGSAYTYARNALHPAVGFVAGWTMLLDYLLMPLMSVIYLSLTVSRFITWVPFGAWLALFATAITVGNLFGLKVTNRANFVMTAVMVSVLVAFVAAAAHALRAGVGSGTLLSVAPFYNPATFSMHAVMAGTSVAAFSFLGFDGVSTLAEDSKNPVRDIGRATVMVCLICGFLFILQAYLGQLAWPDFNSYPKVETAFLDVSLRVGGLSLYYLVSLALVVAGVASAVTAQASASRLMLGMARDRLLPPRVFAYVHPKYSTPTYGILSMGVVTLAGGFFLSFQLAAEAINFGALLGFICVNLCVVVHYYIRCGERRGAALGYNLLAPLAGLGASLYIFLSLSSKAKTIGVLWCAFGLLYVTVLKRGSRKETAVVDAFIQ